MRCHYQGGDKFCGKCEDCKQHYRLSIVAHIQEAKRHLKEAKRFNKKKNPIGALRNLSTVFGALNKAKGWLAVLEKHGG